MIYIRSTGIVSPQGPFGQAPIAHEGNRVRCLEPDYATLIDPKLIRRMSRIIRMGVAAAMACLDKSVPDAIITGTAYGCLEDTNLFLRRMVENKEEMLTPTAFIQSTHNTVGAQIALMLQCHGYNNTFVHRGFSFEHALLDAQMLLADGQAQSVLVGGVDEITDTSHAILSRFGLYKSKVSNNLELLSTPGRGTINGEGAGFFLLHAGSALSNAGSAPAELCQGRLVCLEALETFYKPSGVDETIAQIRAFLDRYEPDIDLVLVGRNGNPFEESIYGQVMAAAFPGLRAEPFKHLCGEYPTATAFALWLAFGKIASGSEKRILIYNHYQNVHHSLYLVSAC